MMEETGESMNNPEPCDYRVTTPLTHDSHHPAQRRAHGER